MSETIQGTITSYEYGFTYAADFPPGLLRRELVLYFDNKKAIFWVDPSQTFIYTGDTGLPGEVYTFSIPTDIIEQAFTELQRSETGLYECSFYATYIIGSPSNNDVVQGFNLTSRRLP